MESTVCEPLYRSISIPRKVEIFRQIVKGPRRATTQQSLPRHPRAVFFVIPAKAGIQHSLGVPRLRETAKRTARRVGLLRYKIAAAKKPK